MGKPLADEYVRGFNAGYESGRKVGLQSLGSEIDALRAQLAKAQRILEERRVFVDGFEKP
jgi:hypothetical protein